MHLSQPIILCSLLAVAAPSAVGASSANAGEQPAPDAFDGSFRLATGEVITGGFFVEGGRGHFLYMDTVDLARGGLFERDSAMVLRSVVPPGVVEIEFVAGPGGAVDRLTWRERGGATIEGQRVRAHRSHEVSFTSDDGTRLEGRLLVPECTGPHPVVIAVHGSGPVDRHGGPYHTFFLQHGIAVLAYDKRGYTPEPGAWREPDLAELAADAAAAVRYVAALPDTDRGRIGLFGSSQAGWVVPAAAVAAPQADFVILRAGAALSWADTSLHEVRQELRAAGLSGEDLDMAVELRRELYALASRGGSRAAADELVAPYLDEPWYRRAFGAGALSENWSSRWWSWIGRNAATAPLPALERFPGAALWFLAERDENVPLVATRAALQRAFAAAPGDDHEIVVIEDARHSFLIERPDAPPRFAQGFFAYMATWLSERGYARPGCFDEPNGE